MQKKATRILLSLSLFFSAQMDSFCQSTTISAELRIQLLRAFDQLKDLDVHVDAGCSIEPGQTIATSLQLGLQYNAIGNHKCFETLLSGLWLKQIQFSEKENVLWLLARAEYFSSRQQFDSAKYLATLANAEAGKKDWYGEKIHALLILSYGGLKTRDITAAYAWADSALQLSRKDHNPLMEGKALLQMGLCARRHVTSFGHRAFPYYLQAADIAETTGDSVTLFAANMFYANDNFEISQWIEGMPHLTNAVKIAMRATDVYEIFRAYIGLGYSLRQQGYSREAMVLFKKALALSQDQQWPYDIEVAYSFISGIYQDFKQYDSALAYVDYAAAVPGVDSFWTNQWEKKAGIYQAMGNYKMAGEMYSKAMDWSTLDFLYRNQQQLSGYEVNLKTKEKELQVSLEKKRAVQLEWIVAGAVLLLIFSAVAFINQRRARKKLLTQNAIIEKQRVELEQSLSEKDMLLKEIHHRVKNNLSVIGSLLELQSSGMQDEKAKAAILEGQNRVRSIALIHQRLYQHENLSAIEFGGFVQDMLREVSGIFKKPGQKIDTELQVPETLLDIDTAVPLGLIMNELLTNSFKYAFTESRQGIIRINLSNISAGNYLLTYSDNGPGMPPDFDLKKSRSLGLRLIYRLSSQVGGSAEYSSDEGCMFVIRFKDALTRNREA